MLIAIDYDGSGNQRRSSCQKPGGSTGIAQEQRLFRWQQRARAGDDKCGVIRLGNCHAHRSQGFCHIQRIVALQSAGQAAGATAQASKQPRPVGERF